jgi:glucosyl-3-phosphoglycerate synthase
MSDFSQPGAICTLQRLNETHLGAIEERLARAAAERPITLILPCLGADLAEPAFAHICAELRGAAWLREVIVSVNGGDAALIERARVELRGLPARILWNDGPELAPVYAELLGRDASELPHGKGFNVWAALGLLASEGAAAVVATQDCDVASFKRANLARLCLPCAEPRLGFRFAKMYYSRVSDRLYGRVTRLFFHPLLRALLRVSGHRPLLDFLLAFRYALAGEMAIERSLAESLEVHPGWGLEVATLCEVFRHAELGTVCQVDGGAGYDHRHQPLRPGGGLERMCGEISAAVLAQFEMEGLRLDRNGLATLAAAFEREGELALRRSEALAIMNDLPFDEEQERGIVVAFASRLALQPAPRAVLPPWRAMMREQGERVRELSRRAIV